MPSRNRPRGTAVMVASDPAFFLSAGTTSTPELRNAGGMPKPIPADIAIAVVKISTLASGRTSRSSGEFQLEDKNTARECHTAVGELGSTE